MNPRRRGTVVLSHIDIVERNGRVHTFYCDRNGLFRDRKEVKEQAKKLGPILRAKENTPAVVDDPQPIPPSTGSPEDVNAHPDHALSMPVVFGDAMEGPFQSSIGTPRDLFSENMMPFSLENETPFSFENETPFILEPDVFSTAHPYPHQQADPFISDLFPGDDDQLGY